MIINKKQADKTITRKLSFVRTWLKEAYDVKLKVKPPRTLGAPTHPHEAYKETDIMQLIGALESKAEEGVSQPKKSAEILNNR